MLRSECSTALYVGKAACSTSVERDTLTIVQWLEVRATPAVDEHTSGGRASSEHHARFYMC